MRFFRLFCRRGGQIVEPLTGILRACLAWIMRWITCLRLEEWRKWYLSWSNIRRTCCVSAKDFRTISLMSFLLETLESYLTYILKILSSCCTVRCIINMHDERFFHVAKFHSTISMIKMQMIEKLYDISRHKRYIHRRYTSHEIV